MTTEKTDSKNATADSDSETGSDTPDLNPETLKLLRDDLQRTHQESLTNVGELSTKATRIIQLNGLVLTILASVASQITLSEYLNVGSLISVSAFVCSILLAGIAFRNKPVKTGPQKSLAEDTIENNFSETQYLLQVTYRGYAEWIEEADQVITERAKFIQWAIYSFILGILALLAGIVLSLDICNYIICQPMMSLL